MEDASHFHDKNEFIQTDTGNKVNRKTYIYGSQNITVNGKVGFNI
jgi:hypothetical protein